AALEVPNRSSHRPWGDARVRARRSGPACRAANGRLVHTPPLRGRTRATIEPARAPRMTRSAGSHGRRIRGANGCPHAAVARRCSHAKSNLTDGPRGPRLAWLLGG